MQFSLRISTLSASLVVLLSLQAVTVESQSITLPLKRVEQRSDLHPHILLQMQINRGIHRLARMTGTQPPSVESLEKRLQKRLLLLDVIDKHYNDVYDPREVQLEKRFNPANVSGVKRQEPVTPANPPCAPNSLGLDIQGNDAGYLATVQIGTPPQNFLIQMDSGSADFWVRSNSCNTVNSSSGCGNHTFFGSNSSSSFEDTQNIFNTSYGTGEVFGSVVRDNVEIACLLLLNHTFGVANLQTAGFSSVPYDGLMGLAKSSASRQNTPTPIESLASAGLVSAAIVSYKISRLADHKNEGEITFGALDDSKFNSSTLVTVPNVNSQGFWGASLDNVSVNGVDLGLTNRTTIFDTGTALMLVPINDSIAIHHNIPGAKSSDDQGDFTVPCNTTASIALTYGGQSFTIDPRDIVLQPVGTQGDCASGITPANFSGGVWLAGDVFLKNAYFSTDVSNNTISFAKLV